MPKLEIQTVVVPTSTDSMIHWMKQLRMIKDSKSSSDWLKYPTFSNIRVWPKSNSTGKFGYLTKTPFFIGRTHFCTTNLGIWYVFGQEAYIHIVAQETRIIRKLFIFNFFVIKKGRNRDIIELIYFFDYRILLPISTFLMKK